MRSLLLVLVCVLAPPASAQKTPVQRFNDGLDHARATRYAEAIAIWLEVVDDVDPARVHKALGLAYRKLDKPVEAWHHLRTSHAAAPDAQVTAWLKELSGTLSRERRAVRLECEGRVTPAGGRAYACPLHWWLTPGPNAVRLAGGTEIVVAVPGPPGDDEVRIPVVDPAAVTVTTPAPSDPRRAWGLGLVGTAGAGLVIGGVLHGAAAARNDDLHSRFQDPTAAPVGSTPKEAYDTAFDDEVAPKMTAAWALYGVAVGAAVAGTVLLLTSDVPGPTVDAAVGPAGAHVSVTLPW